MSAAQWVRLGGRLAQLRPWTNRPADWDRRWSSSDVAIALELARDGRLGPWQSMAAHLPPGGRVLEAGCSYGAVVVALCAQGFEAEGVDFADDTIARALAVDPSLPLSVGDVTALDVADGHYDGYVSIGVAEHDPEGPDAILREARRVLRPGGVALISVPQLTRRRQARRRRADEVALADVADRFYQYYFTADEFEACLRRHALEPFARHPYGVYAGLTRDIGWIDRAMNSRWLPQAGRAWADELCRRAPRRLVGGWAHMLMLAARAV
ncbi:MAG: class I SAM-dependent methyltransferase [Acidobacteriota bacterium]